MTKILIAEDNATNRELFRELLEARGYTVVEACDGLEALRMIEQERPDMLPLDIGMPGLDGFAVVRAIREKPNLFALPVLAVTAYAMQGGPRTRTEGRLRRLPLEADQCQSARPGTRASLELAR